MESLLSCIDNSAPPYPPPVVTPRPTLPPPPREYIEAQRASLVATKTPESPEREAAEDKRFSEPISPPDVATPHTVKRHYELSEASETLPPASDEPLPELVGPWQLPSTGYRGTFEQHAAPVIYGPLTFGNGSSIVTWYDGIGYPVQHVHTFEPAVQIKDTDVLDLTAFLSHAIGSGKDFVFLHDLRNLWPSPSRVQLGALVQFVRTNKKAMDNQLKAIAIVLINPFVRKLINFFLWLFSPKQPCKIFETLEEGYAFLRLHCPPEEIL